MTRHGITVMMEVVLLLPLMLSGCATAAPHNSKAARQKAIRRGMKLMAAIIEGAISGPRRGS